MNYQSLIIGVVVGVVVSKAINLRKPPCELPCVVIKPEPPPPPKPHPTCNECYYKFYERR